MCLGAPRAFAVIEESNMSDNVNGGLAESLALAERVRLAQAAPAMLAALQELVADATGAAVVARNQANAAGDYSAAYVTRLTRAIEAGRAAIAAATGER
jgi:hypothetical protein